MSNKNVIHIFFLIFLLSSCDKKEIIKPELCANKNYLHLSHTRTELDISVDENAKNIDFQQFDMLFLGGDLDVNSSQSRSSMDNLNSIFNLGSETTLWSLGNHDYTDVNLISEYTNRSAFYAKTVDGITFVVLDTQENEARITGQQKVFLDNILDTIQYSSHLVLLHHKLVWMYANKELTAQINDISNGELGDCNFCLNPNNFNLDIYPKLVAVEQKGIDVICIGGDIGKKAKVFQHITDDGVIFLASGIQSGEKDNKVIVFCHDVTNRSLNWKFIKIESVLK